MQIYLNGYTDTKQITARTEFDPMSTYIVLVLARGHDDVIIRPNIFFILQSSTEQNEI